MSVVVDVQYHDWPWSVGCRQETASLNQADLSVNYYGSPVISISENAHIILSRRYEQFSPIGPSFLSIGGKFQLYQAPHGVIALKHISGKKQDTFCFHNKLLVKAKTGSLEIELCTSGALSSTDNNNGDISDSLLFRSVLSWSTFFDDCIDVAKKKNRISELTWEEIAEYISNIAEDSNVPKKSLIVHIAEIMRQRIPSIVSSARKILLRERRMLPAARVAETDNACIRWFVRQPGTNAAQKSAANKQRLMAVSRRESLNTLENKVLKDFLYRCKMECQKYLRFDCSNNQQDTSRAKLVRYFRYICKEQHHSPHLSGVSKPPVGIRPNYVLQNDSRYRQIWTLYQRLLRQEDEEDRLWDWQSRTWADIARLLMNLSLISLCKETSSNNDFNIDEISASFCEFFHEQRLGSRLVPGTEPGPFLVQIRKNDQSSSSILEIVHSDLSDRHPATKSFGRIGGHIYLVVTPLNGKRQSLISVWMLHTAACSPSMRPDWDNIRLSASDALQRHSIILGERIDELPNLYGVVIASDLEAVEPDIHPSSPGRAHLIQVPTSPNFWKKSIEYIALAAMDILETTV